MLYKLDHRAAVVFSSRIGRVHTYCLSVDRCMVLLAQLHAAVFSVISWQSKNLPVEYYNQRAQGLVLGAEGAAKLTV